jgi:hypothetical protein
MGWAELGDCTSSEYPRQWAVVEIGAPRLPGFMNTNREEMKPPPGLVTTYDREPVVQSWSIDGSSVTGPHAFECVPLATALPAVADHA